MRGQFRALSTFFLAAELRGFLIWCAAVVAFNLLNVFLFNIYGDQTSIAQVYARLPLLWRNLFGQYFIAVNTQEGWLAMQLFSFLPVYLGSYSAVAAASLFSKEEENHSILFLLTQPVPRGVIFAAKAAVLLSLMLLSLLLNLIATVAAVAIVSIRGGDPTVFLLSYAMCACLLFFLLQLFMLVSVSQRSQKSALSISLGILILLFLLNSLLSTLELSTWVRRLNPFYYYDCSKLIRVRRIPLGGLVYWFGGGAILAAAGLAIFQTKERL